MASTQILLSGQARNFAAKFLYGFSLMVFLLSQCVAMVSALSPDQKKVFQEGIYYYNTDDCNPSSSATTTGPVAVGQEIPDDQIPGQGWQAKEWNYLIALGFTPVQAAGVMGNIANEGVYDPENSAENPDPSVPARSKDPYITGSYGWGLFGFTPGYYVFGKSGSYWQASNDAANIHPTKDNVYYISTEMDVEYAYMKHTKGASGNSLLDEYKAQATSPAAAADAWMTLAEKPLHPNFGPREHDAIANMNKFGRGSGNNAGSIATGGTASSGSQSGGTACCDTGSTDAGPAGGAITGDVQSLAQQVLQNKNVSFDYGDSGKVAANFKRLANGDQAQTDTGRSVKVQPILLVSLLYLAQDHKVQVSSFTDGSSHTSSSDPHGMGDAMDLDYLDGTELNNQSAVNKTVSGLEQVLPSGSRFGMGHPFGGAQTVDGKTFTAFGDNPNSVHFDVVDVDQGARDKAVEAVGSVGGNDVTGTASSNTAQCCGGGGANFGTGTLPPSVPKPYNAIFTAAANKYGLAPALLAGLFYGGEHGNSWPDPPPPYGHGGPWATNPSSGASGPFQFLPSTWASEGVDGNADGKKDIQDLTDAAFGAANYLHNSGARGSDESTFQKAIFAYNHADWYVQDVLNAYHKFGGAASGSGSGGSPDATATTVCSTSTTGYQNPLRDVQGLFKRRIDQGVDYGGHGPIYAIGNGVVNNAYAEGSSDSGWPGGGWVSYTLSDGPAKGKIVYFAESCDPKVKVGQQVTSSTVICQMNGDNYPWIETGWAASGSTGDTQPLAQQYGGNGCCSTTVGVNFSDLLKSLGAPPGILTNNPPIGQPLPSSFPTWK